MGTRRLARMAAQQHKHRQPNNSMPHMAAEGSMKSQEYRGVEQHTWPQRLNELPVTVTPIQIFCEYLNSIAASYILLDVQT